MKTTFSLNKPEANGKVEVEENSYGVGININGYYLAAVDLFYGSELGKGLIGSYPQLIIYNAADEVTAIVKWDREGNVTVARSEEVKITSLDS